MHTTTQRDLPILDFPFFIVKVLGCIAYMNTIQIYKMETNMVTHLIFVMYGMGSQKGHNDWTQAIIYRFSQRWCIFPSDCRW